MLFGMKTRGGVRLAGRKERTRRKPLCELDTNPRELVLFLDSGTGVEAKPHVTVGAQVRRYDRLAVAQGEDDLPIYAPLSGKVTAIELRADSMGVDRMAIVLAVDDVQRDPAHEPRTVDVGALAPADVLALTRTFGIVDRCNGNVFPLFRKVQDARGRVDTLIINGTECQPYLTATHRLALDMGRDLMVGGTVLARLLGVRTTIFAITGDQLTAAERVERELRRGIHGDIVGRVMKTKIIPTRYPLWDDKVIIQATTRREVPPNGVTNDVGCCVLSLAAVCAFGQALSTGYPQTHHAVTVSGGLIVRPRNFWVPSGTSMEHLIAQCDGVSEQTALVLMGGLMTGRKPQDLTAPLEDVGLLCLGTDELPQPSHQQVCLQCGSCMEACPMALSPVFIMRSVTAGQVERLVGLHPQDCIQCGACCSVCPSHIPLFESVRRAQEMVAQEVAE